nr:Gag-Pol polyprotein [Tanacetum cinerariifolium]
LSSFTFLAPYATLSEMGKILTKWRRKVMNVSSWGILLSRELIECLTRVIMESIHVNFDELPLMASDQLSSDPAPECQTMALNHDSLSPANQRQANVTQADRTVTTTRRQQESDAKMCMFALTVSRTKPKNIKEALADSAWIESMQEELHQFDRLDVWELVDRPLCTNVINLKWLWKNRCDEENTVIRNKSRLVAKGYA